MTGFGAAAVGGVRVEIKTVNHRGLEVRVVAPPGLEGLESGVVERVRKRLVRGRVEVRLAVDVVALPAALDLDELDNRAARWSAAARHLGRTEPPPLTWLLAGTSNAASPAGEALLTQSGEATEAALDALVAFRRREGAAMVAALDAELLAMSDAIATIETSVPEISERAAERLRTRLAVLFDGEIDPQRLAQEVALLAEKRDVREELVRFAEHQRSVVAALSGDQPVGRRLNFIAQELLREANTIGSKCQDLGVAQRVIDLKVAIERLREQIQNLE
jgi:uncharacterized protein (TIGR00255 family)